MNIFLISMWILPMLLISVSCRLGQTTLSLTNTNASTITNYNTDFGSCMCDLNTKMCDMFCCCDSLCQAQSASWQAANICSASNVLKEVSTSACSSSSSSRLANLNCIYFNNAGTIGQYYPTSSQTYPAVDKMGELLGQTVVDTYLDSNIYIVQYSIYSKPNSPIRTDTSFISLPKQILGGMCTSQNLLLGEEGTYSCTQYVDTTNCQNLNPKFQNICKDANCLQKFNITPDLPTSNISVNDCIDLIETLNLQITLSGNNTYTIESISQTNTIRSVTVLTGQSAQYTFTANIVVKKNGAQAKSGAPGYIFGKEFQFFNETSTISLQPLRNNVVGSSGECIDNTITATAAKITFGQSFSLKCQLANCNQTNLAISSILSGNHRVLRYGDNQIAYSNKDMVSISFQPRSNPQCLVPQKTTLNIVYSYAGTSYDPQYYVVSAVVSYQEQYFSNVTEFNIRWVYMDPASVVAPVNNLFYQYFQKLWTPLKNVYYQAKWGLRVAFVVLLSILTFI